MGRLQEIFDQSAEEIRLAVMASGKPPSVDACNHVRPFPTKAARQLHSALFMKIWERKGMLEHSKPNMDMEYYCRGCFADIISFDFYDLTGFCFVWEDDGGIHKDPEQKIRDGKRDRQLLAGKKYIVIRVEQEAIYSNLLGVVEASLSFIDELINDPSQRYPRVHHIKNGTIPKRVLH